MEKYLTTIEIAKKYGLARRTVIDRLKGDRRYGKLTTRNVTQSGRIKAYLEDSILKSIMTWPKHKPKNLVQEGNLYMDVHLGGEEVPDMTLHVSAEMDDVKKFVKFLRSFREK